MAFISIVYSILCMFASVYFVMHFYEYLPYLKNKNIGWSIGLFWFIFTIIGYLLVGKMVDSSKEKEKKMLIDVFGEIPDVIIEKKRLLEIRKKRKEILKMNKYRDGTFSQGEKFAELKQEYDILEVKYKKSLEEFLRNEITKIGRIEDPKKREEVYRKVRRMI